MSVSRTFVDQVRDLLDLVGPIDIRSMFGGKGLYFNGAIFGLLDDDELYFKTDDESKAPFIKAKCDQWTYPGQKGSTETRYYRPPDNAFESAEDMLPWAKSGIETAKRAQLKKAAKPVRKKKARP